MRIKATIEYDVNPKDYNNVTEIEEEEQCRLIACLGDLWSNMFKRSIKVEEVK